MHMLELAERGGVPCGWILEIVARQPDLLSRGGKGAEEGNKPGVGRIRGSVACNTLLVTPNPPSSWDSSSCKRMSTQAWSCW